ncbi:MAG: DUF1573 domain-containing protein [Deltaproteobacteria bacterium]|nr:DUF1573 domain-containing protein [Deltaproteobacteria bacterium]
MLKLIKYFIELSVIFVFFPTPYAHAIPCAKVDQPDFYAGEVPQGKEIIHDFTLKNTGDETLVIRKIKPC